MVPYVTVDRPLRKIGTIWYDTIQEYTTNLEYYQHVMFKTTSGLKPRTMKVNMFNLVCLKPAKLATS